MSSRESVLKVLYLPTLFMTQALMVESKTSIICTTSVYPGYPMEHNNFLAENEDEYFYLCPVCGFDELDEPPAMHMICPCCGTQFDYHDYVRTHLELRHEWIMSGAKWHSRHTLAPAGWNAIKQLTANLDYKPTVEEYQALLPGRIIVNVIASPDVVVSMPSPQAFYSHSTPNYPIIRLPYAPSSSICCVS